jgi:cytochrome c oxidase cbb3-type subunit 3
MKSWKSELSPNQIAEVSSYILSLQGTNPANAKAPEGNLYTPTAASDSTGTTLPDSTATAAVKDSIK